MKTIPYHSDNYVAEMPKYLNKYLHSSSLMKTSVSLQAICGKGSVCHTPRLPQCYIVHSISTEMENDSEVGERLSVDDMSVLVLVGIKVLGILIHGSETHTHGRETSVME